MTATYNSSLPSDKDWVRFVLGDRDGSSAVLQDEEINEILAEEANKYLAAAICGEAVLALGKDAVSKSVGNLSISFGSSSPESAYRALVSRLRERGCQLLLETSGGAVLRSLGTDC